MGKLSGLIVVVILVLQIVASIIQSRRKEQEKQRAREAAARRQMLAEGEAQPSTLVTLASADVGGASSSSSVELEARRRAQLEQLRQRREGRRFGQPSMVGSAGGSVASPPTAPRAGVPLPRVEPSRAASQPQSQPWTATSDQARSRQQENERRARDQARMLKEQQMRLTEERDAATRAIVDRERSRREASQRQSDQHKIATVAAAAGAKAAASISSRLHQPAALRDLIALKEVLDQPVALREPIG